MISKEQRKIILNAFYGGVTHCSCYADTDSVKLPHVVSRDNALCMYDVYKQLAGFKRGGVNVKKK